MLSDARALLLCPHCGTGWDASASGPRSLVCTAGHRFDAARQGYVNFLTGRGSRLTPDTPAMVQARERFLAAGHFAPAAEALAEACAGLPEDAALLDAGAGTGYYLAAVLGARRRARAVALDLSPHALRRAAKVPGVAAVVWDLWRPLPLPDASVDAVLDVFAPRNLPEFARVTRPGGLLCVVTPLPEHLAELRDRLPMLDVPAGKADALEREAEGAYEPVARRRVTMPLSLAPEEAADLALMGPAGHHADRDQVLARLGARRVEATGAVELSVLRRR
ncbi:methyltransferase domain-containing protein [Sinomonas mesophila]|uniref:methyltransferase domain-containing protein n=1 Tax=Sinomonas mesophila TaxID=1531955 RepID=UPI000986EF86|nr:methyltransferase domain-containing protein [Sinomonas mesophila]